VDEVHPESELSKLQCAPLTPVDEAAAIPPSVDILRYKKTN
jgi:hypothetical protein